MVCRGGRPVAVDTSLRASIYPIDHYTPSKYVDLYIKFAGIQACLRQGLPAVYERWKLGVCLPHGAKGG